MISDSNKKCHETLITNKMQPLTTKLPNVAGRHHEEGLEQCIRKASSRQALLAAGLTFARGIFPLLVIICPFVTRVTVV